MVVIGLTGSIGMGKSVAAGLFRAAGIAVHDSDATVHRLYREEAVGPVGAAFPGTVHNGVVDREALAKVVFADERAMSRLESIVHPLVQADRQRFLARHDKRGTTLVVLDIPLLFESCAEAEVDVIVVVDAPEAVQKSRVLARPGMTAARFDAIMAKQVPSALKRSRAHFVVDSDLGIASAERQIRSLLRALAGGAQA